MSTFEESFEESVDRYITKAQKLLSLVNNNIEAERQAASPVERSYIVALQLKIAGGELQKQLSECVQMLRSLETEASDKRDYSVALKIRDVLDTLDPEPPSPAVESNRHSAHGPSTDEDDQAPQQLRGDDFDDCAIVDDFSGNGELCSYTVRDKCV